MKTLLSISVLALFLASVPGTCQAMISYRQVSVEEAKTLGMEVRAIPAGPNGVRIELEFSTSGELKAFNPDRYSRVDLWITGNGRHLLTAPLKMERPAPDRVFVWLYTDRANLERLSLMVIVGAGKLPGGGYELPLKDFVNLQTVDAKPAPKTEAAVTPAPAATALPPATATPAPPASVK